MSPQTTSLEFTSTPSEEQIAIISNYIEKGLQRQMAGYAAGVSEGQLQHWLELNPRLEITFGAAECRFQARCLEAILAPGDGKNKVSVRAIMWLLQHRFPSQFGKAKPARRPVTEAQPARSSEPQTPELTSETPEISKPELANIAATSAATPQGPQSIAIQQNAQQPIVPVATPVPGLRVLEKFAYTQGRRRT